MDADLTPEEALSQRHKQEKRDLQATIQGLKKTATKGDKKKKKEVQEQISKLEADLLAKHDAELKALIEIEPAPVEEVIEEISNVEIDDKGPKLTKAQKRRMKKESTNKEREQRIAEQEIENEHGVRNTETNKIKEILKKKDLMIFEIPSDGDCLYNAVKHGLKKMSVVLDVQELRRKVSLYILNHPQNYLPFLTDTESGNTLNEDQLKAYCDKIANTKQWGGQVELDAVCNVIQKTIVVIQADGPELIMGEEYRKQGEIILCYHRHMYNLGEHYNSVQPYYEAEQEF